MPYAVEDPESTHDTEETSALFVVVASYPVSVRTIELALPVPHTTDPAAVPYAAPTAKVPMLPSAVTVVGPVNATAAVRPVGNV